METISDLEQHIRDFINSPRKQYALLQSQAAWNMLCSCLDLIGDTGLALDAYVKHEEAENYGGKYLLIYGVLQALFLQQDAVENLCEALKLDYTPDPLLNEIREIRNDSTGHPTKRGGGQGRTFNFISRISLSKVGFDLMKTYPEDRTPFFQHVSIPSLVARQREILQRTLSAVVDKLQNEDTEHREQFRAEKLQNLFLSTGYYFQKMLEAIRGGPAVFGTAHIKLIAEIIDAFKSALTKRGELEACDTVTYFLNLLEYPMGELTTYFNSPDQPRLNEKSACIFVFFVEKHVDELRRIAREMDEIYESKP
ncbi:MAG: hypothetical protein NTX17_07870 [Candidatus Eisenbacteria bacterium]|nr:hypothetical protein [Candidatus Eisenbacteria bacterium]